MKSVLGSILGALGGFACIGAGAYLLLHTSGQAESTGVYDASMLDLLARGMGVYFIGKGLAVLSSTIFLEHK